MREIKFRAWDKDNKRMLEVILDQSWPAFDGDETKISAADCFEWPEKYIPLQYTGLKDKHSKEIYEGDILKQQHVDSSDFEIHVVEYEDGDWSYTYWKQEGGWEPNQEWEVIGNIYENPELLDPTQKSDCSK